VGFQRRLCDAPVGMQNAQKPEYRWVCAY
jgi:hypothetical protein